MTNSNCELHMKYILSIFIIIIHIVMIGCSQKVVYKEIKIPIQCDITMPQKPKLTQDNFLEDLSKVLIYTETLEKDLKFCIGVSQ